MELNSKHIRRSISQSMKAGLLSMLFTSALGIAEVVSLAEPEADASQQSSDSFQRWKQLHVAAVAFAALIVVPLLVAAARFASVFPPRPLNFLVSLGSVAFAAAIAHNAATPVKGAAIMRSLW